MRGVYIHIPFCNKICSYCDFAKFYYQEDYVDKYLDALEEEINSKYLGDVVDTVYIGGGTPSSLNLKQLEKLLKLCHKFKLNRVYEFTFEANPESITTDKLKLLKKYGVNRLSIGIETFNEHLLRELNRDYVDFKNIVELSKKYISNINVDLMYALPSEDDIILTQDVNKILDLNVNHISTYSLILEEHTRMYVDGIKNIDEEIDREMYDYINDTLTKHGYKHYETSNYAKEGYESHHNLKYWNNAEYYGFGIGASGYINNVRYTNTRSFNDYINKKYCIESHKLTKLEDMQNYMILGLRKTTGVSISEFKNKYHKDIKDTFKIDELLTNKSLLIDGDMLFINPKFTYVANEILIYFI